MLHVLFLNTQDNLRADVSVHVSLARALDRDAIRVSTATSVFEGPGESARAAFGQIGGMTLLPLNLGRPISQQSGIRRALAMVHNVRAAQSLVSLAAWCRKERVDVVHVTERPRDAIYGFLLARLAGAACLIHAHTSYYAHQPSATLSLVDWTLRHADAVVGVSRFTADTFWRTGNVARDRVYAVHNAVDVAVQDACVPDDARSAMRRQLDIPEDALVVGSVGRLMQGKDQASLLEAFAAVRATHPAARLVIAGLSADASPDGQGDYRDYLIRRTAALGLTDAVVFTGFLPHLQMSRLYAAFDVFVHPCVEEPFGLVIVEAMARSLPVIAIRGGGVSEIIRDGVDGLLMPPRQPRALAEAITKVFDDQSLAARLAQAGRRRVDAAFTPRAQAGAMLEVYRDVTLRTNGKHDCTPTLSASRPLHQTGAHDFNAS